MAGGTAPASLETAAASTDASTGQRSYLPALITLTTLFFMWGFLTCLNDVIIPHLKAVFSLSYFEAMLVQFCFFTAYGIMSIPSGVIVKRIGFRFGIMVGLAGAAIGCLMFYPAAGVRSYPLFLAAFFVLASGIVVLQVSANPFVAVLGPAKTASSRLTMTQAFNSLATTVAPRFGHAFILSTAALSAAELAQRTPAEQDAYRIAEAASVQHPYIGLAIALAVLAGIVAVSRLPKIDTSSVGGDGAAGTFDDRGSAWKYPHLVLGAIAIFLYVGGEVAIGSLLVNYLKEPYTLNLPVAQGADYLSYYWGGAMVGRFVGSLTLRWFRPGKLLSLHALVAALLVAISVIAKGNVAAWTVIAVGLFNSIMFPTIFTMAIDGLGRHTEQGSGILCTAIIGGAFVPAIQGALADAIGLHISFVVPALCYVYIAWYGLRGHPVRRAVVAPATV